MLLAGPDDPRRFFWLRARGMSKTGDAAAILLALLLTEAPPRSRSYCYAADADQAALVLDSIVGYVQRTGLSALVEVGARSVTCLATGATLTVESSDSASAFGTRPWSLVLDEAAQWPDTPNHRRLFGALISAQAKVPGSRLLMMSSAGSPSHPAHKWWQTAEASEHWVTSLQTGPSPWWSSADTAAAVEQLTPAEVRRYILCEWAEAEDALAATEDVVACTGTYLVREPQRGVTYVAALDVGTRRDATVLAVGHLEAGPVGRRVVIDRVQRWTGTRLNPVSLTEVEQAVVATSRLYHRAAPRLRPDAGRATDRAAPGLRRADR